MSSKVTAKPNLSHGAFLGTRKRTREEDKTQNVAQATLSQGGSTVAEDFSRVELLKKEIDRVVERGNSEFGKNFSSKVKFRRVEDKDWFSGQRAALKDQFNGSLLRLLGDKADSANLLIRGSQRGTPLTDEWKKDAIDGREDLRNKSFKEVGDRYSQALLDSVIFSQDPGVALREAKKVQEAEVRFHEDMLDFHIGLSNVQREAVRRSQRLSPDAVETRLSSAELNLLNAPVSPVRGISSDWKIGEASSPLKVGTSFLGVFDSPEHLLDQASVLSGRT